MPYEPLTGRDADAANPYATGYYNGFHARDGYRPADREGEHFTYGDIGADGFVAYNDGWAAGLSDYNADGFYGESADPNRLSGLDTD